MRQSVVRIKRIIDYGIVGSVNWTISRQITVKRLGVTYKKLSPPQEEMLRIPHRLGNRLTDGSEVLRRTNRPLSTPSQPSFCFWFLFRFEAE
jgi:hypothetical protein